MKRFIGILTSILFVVWLLPLGVFIAPSEEKIVCGGKRAICLCSHRPDKTKAEHKAEAPSYQSGSAQVHELASGVTHPFESFDFDLNVISKPNALNSFLFNYSFRNTPRIDHVPKVV